MAISKLFVSKRVLINNSLTAAGILVSEGKIKEIISEDKIEAVKTDTTIKVIDVGENVLMPGIIDSHVHVNEPGRTEWEGFESATKAAVAGGVTTIVDMPLNSIPPTTTLENFNTKLSSTKGKLHSDVAFWGGVIPNNQNELLQMVDAGVIGFKCFMGPSGIDEFPHVNYEDIEKALKVLEGTDAVLAFHAEIDQDVDIKNDDPKSYNTYLKSRPAEMEENAIKMVAELCGSHQTRCHIVHVSAASALPIIKAAKEKCFKLTAETCHHYLSLIAEEIPDNNTQFKCAPPIRESDNRTQLWDGLKSGILDLVVSDHSPCTPDLKFLGKPSENSGNFIKAWGGISSLQFGLSLFWTEGRKRGFKIEDINRLMTVNPAKLAGLNDRKGQIKEGFDADFVVWDPEATITISETMIHHKNKVTPYAGKTLQGKVIRTVVRGETVFENGKHSKPLGQILKKK